jgi:hypothetical protein
VRQVTWSPPSCRPCIPCLSFPGGPGKINRNVFVKVGSSNRPCLSPVCGLVAVPWVSIPDGKEIRHRGRWEEQKKGSYKPVKQEKKEQVGEKTEKSRFGCREEVVGALGWTSLQHGQHRRYPPQITCVRTMDSESRSRGLIARIHLLRFRPLALPIPPKVVMLTHGLRERKSYALFGICPRLHP